MIRTPELFSILKPLPEPRHVSLHKEGEMSRAINFSTIPDDELLAANTSVLVFNAYTTAMALGRDERKAVEAAIRGLAGAKCQCRSGRSIARRREHLVRQALNQGFPIWRASRHL